MRLGVYEAFQQALIHLKAERPNDAAGALYLAAAAWPDVAEIRFLIGCVEERAGNPGMAADGYRKALTLDPDHKGAGECLAQMTAEHFAWVLRAKAPVPSTRPRPPTAAHCSSIRRMPRRRTD